MYANYIIGSSYLFLTYCELNLFPLFHHKLLKKPLAKIKSICYLKIKCKLLQSTQKNVTLSIFNYSIERFKIS